MYKGCIVYGKMSDVKREERMDLDSLIDIMVSQAKICLDSPRSKGEDRKDCIYSYLTELIKPVNTINPIINEDRKRIKDLLISGALWSTPDALALTEKLSSKGGYPTLTEAIHAINPEKTIPETLGFYHSMILSSYYGGHVEADKPGAVKFLGLSHAHKYHWFKKAQRRLSKNLYGNGSVTKGEKFADFVYSYGVPVGTCLGVAAITMIIGAVAFTEYNKYRKDPENYHKIEAIKEIPKTIRRVIR